MNNNDIEKILCNKLALCPNITFVHTKGHNGNKWNEYCDKLAVGASKQIG